MTTVTALPTDPVLPLRQGLERMRSAFRSDMAPTLAARRDRLSRLARMTRRHAKDIIEHHFRRLRAPLAARNADRGPPCRRRGHRLRAAASGGAGCARSGSRRDSHVPARYNRLLSQPLGVVGVVAPWNYPYQLSMLPARGGARRQAIG